MATKSWYADAVTTEADLVSPASGSTKVTLASVYVTNAGASATAAVVVKVTTSANALRATLLKPTLAAGQSVILSGIALQNGDKLRVSSDNVVSCYASGDET